MFNDLSRRLGAVRANPDNLWQVYELCKALAACGVAPDQLGRHVETLSPGTGNVALAEGLAEFRASRVVEARMSIPISLRRQAQSKEANPNVQSGR